MSNLLIVLVYLTNENGIISRLYLLHIDGAFLSALHSKAPFILYAVGFGVWALFIWGLFRRMKKLSERRFREQQFNNFMRTNRQQHRY